jgi:hypothetical protein
VKAQIIVVLSAFTLIALAPACGGPCEKLASLEKKCREGDKGLDIPEDLIVGICKAEIENNEQVKQQAECAEKAADDCGAFKKCQATVRAQKDIKEIKEATDKGDWSKASIVCEIREKSFEDVPELKQVCDDMYTKALDTLGKDVEAIRDGKSDKKVFNTCFDYKRMAGKISEDKKKAAEDLCKEANAGANVAKAIEDALSAAKEKKNAVPYKCRMVIKELEKIGSDWAKEATKKVAKACYQDLGTVVLAAIVPDMTFCKSAAKEIVTAVDTYGLKGGDLDALVAKAKEKCK